MQNSNLWQLAFIAGIVVLALSQTYKLGEIVDYLGVGLIIVGAVLMKYKK